MTTDITAIKAETAAHRAAADCARAEWMSWTAANSADWSADTDMPDSALDARRRLGEHTQAAIDAEDRLARTLGLI